MFDDTAERISNDVRSLAQRLNDVADVHDGMISLAQHGAFISSDPYELTYALGRALYGDDWEMDDADHV